MTPARFRWGIILILIGLLIFLRNLNVLSDEFWAYFIYFIPVMLIAIGIEKIFTRTKLQFISYATSFLILFGGLAVAFTGSFGNGRDSFFSESFFKKPYDDSVSKIVAELVLDGTALTIRDSGEDIVYGMFDRFTRKPDIDYVVVDDRAELKLVSRRGDFLGGIVKIEPGEAQDWMLRFSRNIPLDFDCTGEDADIHLNLATTPLNSLKLDLQDSFVYLKIGDLVPRVTIKINGEESSVKLRVPEHVGVRINAAGYESYFERVGMRRDDGWFVTDGYDTLKSQVDIDLDAHLSSFSIDYF